MPTLNIEAADMKRLLDGETVHAPNGLRVRLDADAIEVAKTFSYGHLVGQPMPTTPITIFEGDIERKK